MPAIKKRKTKAREAKNKVGLFVRSFGITKSDMNFSKPLLRDLIRSESHGTSS